MTSSKRLSLSGHDVYLYWKKCPKLPYDKKYQVQHQLGRKLLSKALKDLYGINFNESMLSFNEHSKPNLSNFSNVHFNISHSDSYVILALSDLPIGIDVEDVTHFDNSLIKAVFTEEEQELAKSFENHDEHYTRLWTLKESFFKCLGSGLDFPLTKISFNLDKQSYPAEIHEKNCIYYQDKIEDSVFTICLLLNL